MGYGPLPRRGPRTYMFGQAKQRPSLAVAKTLFACPRPIGLTILVSTHWSGFVHRNLGDLCSVVLLLSLWTGTDTVALLMTVKTEAFSIVALPLLKSHGWSLFL